MVPIDRLVAFTAAAFVLIVIPGPSVLFVISRGIALGRRGALATVVGNTAGAFTQAVLVAVGLGAVVERSVLAFNAIKLVGGAYLLYLGVQAIRHRREHTERTEATAPRDLKRIVRDGYLVGVANPKAIVFLAAILPQFTDPASGHLPVQMLILGLIFAAIAFVSDSTWGLAAGTTGSWLSRSPRRIEKLRGLGGVVMIGLGLRVLATGRTE
jgi:threonine/homoserine/homoserine lactone efflux protein